MTPSTHHHHHHPSAKESAAAAQRSAAVIGWVAGEPVPRALLDERVRAMRSGPRACALPVPGTSEDRQLVRWVAHVLFTEAVCLREARRRGLSADEPVALPPLVAVQVGSIAAAAWQACGAVGAVFDAVVPESPGDAPGPRRRWWRVSMASAATRALVCERGLRPIGWSTLDDLPGPLAGVLRDAPADGEVTVEHGGRWLRARVDGVEDREGDDPRARSRLGARAREFARWLDRERAGAVRCAVGFEHPGDPAQPDYTHRH